MAPYNAHKKTIDELTLMDDYMFAQVMRQTDHLKPLLESALQMKISKIELIEIQKTEKGGYDSKGVRLDLYVTDESGTIYNVEVQTSDKKNLPKRMRYYQSVIDISFLSPGMDYKELKKSFIIFICNYDEYRRGRCIYTFENTCREEPDLKFGDESFKILLNTKGVIGETSDELKEVLKYLDDGTITGDYSRKLDDAVKAVKSSEERRLEYMLLSVWKNEMRAEGREEGREQGFAECMEREAKAMYEEGIKPEIIAKIQKVPLEVIEKILGLRTV